eukprot:TRINITY_DN488_c0_g1_i2.p1 TRINITY_DN488_c0_g1~~TRINITY_DN488_c0_g1_i2.p1  ORF type:complete len:612 (+),score=132.76 TRINITY_DN488_c0_g1_i2:59-1894(+)
MAQAQQKQASDKQGPRAGTEIHALIQTLLREKGVPLTFEDFDTRAKQTLHAIQHKGGKEGVARALDTLGGLASKKSRSSVQNWSAYVGAILRRFLNEFEVEMLSGPPSGQDDRVNAWVFKAPAFAEGLEQQNDACDKKSWQNMQGPRQTQPATFLSTEAPMHSPAQRNRQSVGGNSKDQVPWWKNLNACPQPPPPPPSQSWQNASPTTPRWCDTYDSQDDWYAGPWGQQDKWDNWNQDAAEYDGGASSTRWGASQKTTSRRASVGGYSTTQADCGSPMKRKPRMSLPPAAAQADCGSPTKRKARMSLPPAAAQADDCASPKRKPRMSVAGASPKVKDDTEKKSRKSLTGKKEWIPKEVQKAVPTLASMLQPKLTQKHLEKQLAAWVKKGGHSPSDVKLVALRDGEESGRQVASVNARGNEFLVELDTPAGSTKQVVVGAWTRSAWPALKHSISSALQVSSQQNFTDFIGSLLLALPVLEEGCEDRSSPCKAPEPVTSDNAAPYLQDDDVEDDMPVLVGMDQAETLPDQSGARQFCHWLNDRQPLWRVTPGNRTVSWDFPLSRAEKKEYLWLTTEAECTELREENAELKASEAALLEEIEFCNLEKDQEVKP